MNYKECEEYISNISKFIKGDPDKTTAVINRITDNREMPNIIHVAGTNGKGSVCTYIESILSEAGYVAGKFVSPHLVTMRERINLRGEMISEDDFVSSFKKVKKIADNLDYQPNYFEYTLLIAIDYYMNNRPDYIILETGLGGRKDQTNYVTEDKISVITEIGLDHMAYLGDTYEKIAYEKAGIIKKNNKVVYYNKRTEASNVISAEAEKKEAIKYCIEPSCIENIRTDNGNIVFDYNCIDGRKMVNIELLSPAVYQCENASIAIETVLCLNEDCIDEGIIKRGLKSAIWPGRMELLPSKVYLDGAHNADGIQAFIDTVSTCFENKNNYLLFGVVKDKEYVKIVDMLVNSKLFAEIIVVKLDTDRGTSLEELKKVFEKYKKIRVSFCESVKEGYDYLVSKGENSNLFAVGSLYLVGQIKGDYRKI